MQRTRLNTLFDQVSLRFRQWVFNPWRRLSLITLSLLFGNFFATAISATAGQAAKLDVTISAMLVILVELISWTYYRFRPRRREIRLAQDDGPTVLPSLNAPDVIVPPGIDPGPVRSRSTLMESLNAFKLGLIYGLFVEAFKLGS
ncbi:MAG: hypothetical protein DCF25_00170 [Leptolyngbya foveolarum]|uniref:DUF565 domain-containing protein n=1 Tax=Leptolyngbya foveolarum TaxID=47253 RepID=A0A2W4WVW5_9CYAN|nr:MAG: hypothetical protein DCF25_00170 [Leptolyngbya foveolarum]